MSDVGSTLTLPGLPLRDPPRMAGSYGVSMNDQFLECLLGSIPCENPGHRPMPAQAPIPPPPPQQGVGDPVAQLLVGQGAMSHLLIQMAQEMNRRASEQGAGDPSQSNGGQGNASGSRKEMRWMRNGFLRCQQHLGRIGHREGKNYQDSRLGWNSFQVGCA